MTWKDLLSTAKLPPKSNRSSVDAGKTSVCAGAAGPAGGSTPTTAAPEAPPKLPLSSSAFFDPPKLPPKVKKEQAVTGTNNVGLSGSNNNTASATPRHDEIVLQSSGDQTNNKPDLQPSEKVSSADDQSDGDGGDDGSDENNKAAAGAGDGWVVTPKSAPNEQPTVTSPVKAPRGSKPGDDSNNRLTAKGARLQFSKHFIEGIERIEKERSMDLSLRYIQNNPRNARPSSKTSSLSSMAKGNSIKVFIRKRPIAAKESDVGDFDVVRVESLPSQSSSPATTVVVYNTLLQSNNNNNNNNSSGIEKTIKPAIYGGVACFDETSDSDTIYQSCAKPLIDLTRKGANATLVAFGQSGSGKSYTLSAIEGMAASDIFEGLPLNYSIKVSVVELCGQRCRDLTDDALSTVRIVDCGDGSVRFVNALTVPVCTPGQLLQALEAAKRRRLSIKGQGNDFFSRHVVYRIIVAPPQNAPDCVRQGTLTLVDCAGTESRKDSQYADAADINASLWALKECIRAKIAGANEPPCDIPYGYSTLTRVLRYSLESEDAMLHLIANISPTATNTQHTLETLSTVSNLMAGFADDESVQPISSSASQLRPKPCSDEVLSSPKGWDNVALCDWLIRKHLVIDPLSVPKDMNGRQIMKLSKVQLQQTFFDENFKKADLLYRCLRAENDRVARLELKRRHAVGLSW